jgi:hypothetical protein
MKKPDTAANAATRAAAKAGTREHGTPFKEMTSNQKTRFVIKVVICAASFGFIFSNVMYD